MGFERIFDASQASPFKFDTKGTVLEGYYMGSFDYTGDYAPTKKHIFQTKKGAEVVFGQRNLMQQLPAVTPGVMVRITYTGDLAPTKKGAKPMKLYLIEHDRGNKIEVSGVDFTPTEEVADDTAEASNFEPVEEQSLDEEEPQVEAAPLPRAQAPKQAARAPSASNQSKVQELLNRSRAKSA